MIVSNINFGIKKIEEMIVWLKYNFGCSTGNNANIISQH